MHYRQIPSAKYILVSRDEVVVKGSAIEGFSLLMEDAERRGITARLVEILERGGDAASIHEALGEKRITVEELAKSLEEMADSGAILAEDTGDPGEGAWLAFVRYGHVPDLSGVPPLTLVGGEPAHLLADTMATYGLRTEVIEEPADVPLPDFAFEPGTEKGENQAAGIPVNRSATASLVFVADPGRRAEMFRFNERAITARVPFLACSLSGVDISVGPHVVPGRTACLWECERLWARSSATEKEYELMLSSLEERSAPPPTVARAAFATTATPWLLELAIRGTSSLSGQVVRARATSSETSIHAVMRLPRCPVCLPLAPALRNLLY